MGIKASDGSRVMAAAVRFGRQWLQLVQRNLSAAVRVHVDLVVFPIVYLGYQLRSTLRED